MKEVGSPRPCLVSDLRAHPDFEQLFALSTEVVDTIAEDMRLHGYDKTKPIFVARLAGQEGNFVVDGYQRWGGARKAPLEEVWIQEVDLGGATDEGVIAAIKDHLLRRKARQGDILFALCWRAEWLAINGKKRAGPSESAKLQKSNLTEGLGDVRRQRLSHKGIASLYGVSKSTVDHLSVKYVKHLDRETITAIAHNQLDPHRLLEDWDPDRTGDKSETETEEESDDKGESGDESTSQLLELLPLSVEHKAALSRQAQDQKLPVAQLVANWLSERLNQQAILAPAPNNGGEHKPEPAPANDEEHSND